MLEKEQVPEQLAQKSGIATYGPLSPDPPLVSGPEGQITSLRDRISRFLNGKNIVATDVRKPVATSTNLHLVIRFLKTVVTFLKARTPK